MDDDLKALCSRPNVQLITADLCEAGTFDRLDRDYDEVYHMAAVLGAENVLRQPVRVLRVNVLSLWRACALMWV